MEARTIRDCNVAVIGGAGFLGSHLVDHLIEDRGCKVLVLDNLISGKEKHIHRDAEFCWFDIRNEEQELVRVLKRFGTRFVMNYAAEPFIDSCFERPLHFFDINARAVLNVLNACQAAAIEAVLQVSSAEIYGDMDGKISETDPVTPHSTYGVSKLAADGLVQVRWREAKVPAIALRQFNCIAPRLTHKYVTAEIISQIHDNGPVVRLGNNSFRDFQDGRDAVRMATELLEKGQFGEVYNMGAESGIKIYDLARLIGIVMGYPNVTVETDESRIRPWEIWRLQAENAKLYSVIDYRPQYSLDETVRSTVAYFRENSNRWDFSSWDV